MLRLMRRRGRRRAQARGPRPAWLWRRPPSCYGRRGDRLAGLDLDRAGVAAAEAGPGQAALVGARAGHPHQGVGGAAAGAGSGVGAAVGASRPGGRRPRGAAAGSWCRGQGDVAQRRRQQAEAGQDGVCDDRGAHLAALHRVGALGPRPAGVPANVDQATRRLPPAPISVAAPPSPSCMFVGEGPSGPSRPARLPEKVLLTTLALAGPATAMPPPAAVARAVPGERGGRPRRARLQGDRPGRGRRAWREAAVPLEASVRAGRPRAAEGSRRSDRRVRGPAAPDGPRASDLESSVPARWRCPRSSRAGR